MKKVVRFEMHEPDDLPWRGQQPKFEKIVRLGPMRFGLTTKLPDGEPITVELGRFAERNTNPSQ